MHITGPHRLPEAPSRTVLHAACLVAVLAALGGCGGGSGGESGGADGIRAGTNGIACTAELRPSVLLTVLDQANATLPGASVTYQVNGGTSQNQACESGSCFVGFEVAGTFSITAAKTGYSPATGTVTVTQGQCHVNTESLTLRLAPAA